MFIVYRYSNHGHTFPMLKKTDVCHFVSLQTQWLTSRAVTQIVLVPVSLHLLGWTSYHSPPALNLLSLSLPARLLLQTPVSRQPQSYPGLNRNRESQLIRLVLEGSPRYLVQLRRIIRTIVTHNNNSIIPLVSVSSTLQVGSFHRNLNICLMANSLNISSRFNNGLSMIAAYKT